MVGIVKTLQRSRAYSGRANRPVVEASVTYRWWWLAAVLGAAGCMGDITPNCPGCEGSVACSDNECESSGGAGAECTGTDCDDTGTGGDSGDGGSDGTGGVGNSGGNLSTNEDVDPEICTGQRPDGNDGAGFFVSAGKIYDPNGCPFVPQGSNAMAFWNVTVNGNKGTYSDAHLASLGDLAELGANSVRITSQIDLDVPEVRAAFEAWFPTYFAEYFAKYAADNNLSGAALETAREQQRTQQRQNLEGRFFGWNTSPTSQREIIAESADQGLVPILEMHDSTCGNGKPMEQVHAYWTSTEMVQLAQDYEDVLWINYANEVDFASPEEWRDYYIDAIQDLRDLGVKNLIVLDAGKRCGQHPESILAYGQAVLDADPQHNVVFSWHMYGYWYTLPCSVETLDCGAGYQFEVSAKFQELADTGLPLFIGEFGWNSAEIQDYPVSYDPTAMLEEAAKHDIGWSYWMWYEDQPHLQVVTDLTDPTSLTEAGVYLRDYMQSNTKRATIF